MMVSFSIIRYSVMLRTLNGRLRTNVIVTAYSLRGDDYWHVCLLSTYIWWQFVNWLMRVSFRLIHHYVILRALITRHNTNTRYLLRPTCKEVISRGDDYWHVCLLNTYIWWQCVNWLIRVSFRLIPHCVILKAFTRHNTNILFVTAYLQRGDITRWWLLTCLFV